MSIETIAERRARVRSARLLERPLSLRDTITTLKYIGDVDQPEEEHGGFHAHTIRTARSALHHIERLRRRSNPSHHAEPRPGGDSVDGVVRLFVDDQRDPEWFGLEGWTTARTSAEAISILSQGRVVECSLDHDLGGEDTGYKVACWMEEHNVWPKDGTRCHSANPIGKQRIEAVIRKANPVVRGATESRTSPPRCSISESTNN